MKKLITGLLAAKFVKTGLMAAAMLSAIALAPAASAALINGSFEDPDASSGDIPGAGTGWGSFNSNFVSSNIFFPGNFQNPTALDGTQVLKQFGIDAGAFQDVAASAGDKVDAQVFAMNWNGDYFNNIFLLQIFALDAGGNNISGGVTPFAQVAAGSPVIGGVFDYVLDGVDGGDPLMWTQMDVSAVMPTGTASTRIQLIHILEASTLDRGAIFLDNASLTVTASPVPVPATLVLLGLGLAGLGYQRRKPIKAA